MKCVFCNYEGPKPILMSATDVFVIEPLEPCVPGHLFVIPKRHVEYLWSDLDLANTFGGMLARAIIGARLRDRCNVIVNDGAVAGQTVRHLHAHLIPRNPGDNVQMPWSWQGKGGLQMPGPR
jgi:histidine triad (HIT) family protein